VVKVLLAGAAAAFLTAGAALAAAPPTTLPLYPGVAPGSEAWTQVERTTVNPANGGRMVRNVVRPTLEVYRPDPGKAVGLGVVIAPGGGFRFLSYDTEGVQVARWLAERGITGMLLKYRTAETSADDAVAMRRPAPGEAPSRVEGAAEIGAADGVRAMELARQHAAEWGLATDRIGIMGFSAGAQVTLGVVRALAGARPPLFAAPIYGGDFANQDQPPPAGAPPMFLAVSVDDPLAAEVSLKLFQQLRAAGQRPELHVFHRGGHGWGMERHEDTADHWIEEFYWWLGSNGWLKAP
jgi:acetyl esterase/lipase